MKWGKSAAAGAAALAAIMAATTARAYFYFTTYQISVPSTWQTDGDHPYAIWQSKSIRTPGHYQNLANGQVVDLGPMFPTQVYRNTTDLHLKNGEIWIGKYNYFVEMNGGTVNKYGGRKRCIISIKNPEYYKLFTPARGVDSANGILCVELDANGVVNHVHDIRSDNLALFNETKDSFLNGGPDYNTTEQTAFEKVDATQYSRYGRNIFKIVSLKIESKDKDHPNDRLCFQYYVSFLPIFPPLIKLGEKCFSENERILDAFDGQYSITEMSNGTYDVEIIKPFDSPQLKPE